MTTLFPLIGANADLRTTTPLFKPGTPALADDGGTYLYVGPATTVVAKDSTAATVTGTFGINNTSGGDYTVTTAFAIGDYGWVKKTASAL